MKNLLKSISVPAFIGTLIASIVTINLYERYGHYHQLVDIQLPQKHVDYTEKKLLRLFKEAPVLITFEKVDRMAIVTGTFLNLDNASYEQTEDETGDMVPSSITDIACNTPVVGKCTFNLRGLPDHTDHVAAYAHLEVTYSNIRDAFLRTTEGYNLTDWSRNMIQVEAAGEDSYYLHTDTSYHIPIGEEITRAYPESEGQYTEGVDFSLTAVNCFEDCWIFVKATKELFESITYEELLRDIEIATEHKKARAEKLKRNQDSWG